MTDPSVHAGAAQFEKAQQAFAACDAGDPSGETSAYHAAVGRWVLALEPQAALVVQLAALGQHIERWTVPRSDYPLGRVGYRQWRSTLSQLHGRRCAEILRGVGYDEATAQRVAELVTKKRLRSDPEAGLLQDAVCLTFVERQLASFAEGRDPAQVSTILAKTWGKMTVRGQDAARDLAGVLPESVQALFAAALAED